MSDSLRKASYARPNSVQLASCVVTIRAQDPELRSFMCQHLLSKPPLSEENNYRTGAFIVACMQLCMRVNDNIYGCSVSSIAETWMVNRVKAGGTEMSDHPLYPPPDPFAVVEQYRDNLWPVSYQCSYVQYFELDKWCELANTFQTTIKHQNSNRMIWSFPGLCKALIL